jgi:hypothetical protein
VKVEKQLIRRVTGGKFEKRANLEVSDVDLGLIAQQVPDGFAAPTAADVYTASALVCNDLIDSYSTRFTLTALQQIVQLLPGANVMRNHNEYASDDLPIARCYAAELVQQADGWYVRAKFYWERGTDCGEEMGRKIALGIWREVSLSWWMRSFTNSVTGTDFDDTPGSYAGQELPDGQTVVGVMDDVVEVNEFSVVARGGQLNTSMNPANRKDGMPDVLELVSAARARAKQPQLPDPREAWGPLWIEGAA